MGNRILAVDDEPDNLSLIKMVLEEEGFDIETASDGPDCIDSAMENPPDLILLDVMMPQMSGLKVVAELKEEPTTNQIPIIMLTVLSERQTVEDALTSGVDDYVVKSHGFDDLISKSRQAIARAEG